jgi:hypothetical protein
MQLVFEQWLSRNGRNLQAIYCTLLPLRSLAIHRLSKYWLIDLKLIPLVLNNRLFLRSADIYNSFKAFNLLHPPQFILNIVHVHVQSSFSHQSVEFVNSSTSRPGSSMFICRNTRLIFAYSFDVFDLLFSVMLPFDNIISRSTGL